MPCTRPVKTQPRQKPIIQGGGNHDHPYLSEKLLVTESWWKRHIEFSLRVWPLIGWLCSPVGSHTYSMNIYGHHKLDWVGLRKKQGHKFGCLGGVREDKIKLQYIKFSKNKLKHFKRNWLSYTLLNYTQYDLPTIEYFSDKYEKLTCISLFSYILKLILEIQCQHRIKCIK